MYGAVTFTNTNTSSSISIKIKNIPAATFKFTERRASSFELKEKIAPNVTKMLNPVPTVFSKI